MTEVSQGWKKKKKKIWTQSRKKSCEISVWKKWWERKFKFSYKNFDFKLHDFHSQILSHTSSTASSSFLISCDDLSIKRKRTRKSRSCDSRGEKILLCSLINFLDRYLTEICLHHRNWLKATAKTLKEWVTICDGKAVNFLLLFV